MLQREPLESVTEKLRSGRRFFSAALDAQIAGCACNSSGCTPLKGPPQRRWLFATGSPTGDSGGDGHRRGITPPVLESAAVFAWARKIPSSAQGRVFLYGEGTMGTMRRLWDWFVSAFHRPTLPTLTNHLPRVPGRIYPDVTSSPISSRAIEERAEAMLLDIMRAPPEYAEAAMLVARATIALRARGENVFAEGLVVFTLARMVPDNDGAIPFQRLRARLGELPTRKSIIATLLRLEEQGVVKFDSDAQSDAADASRVMRLDDVRIRLMVEP